MKQLNQFIYEKLKINKDTKVKKYDFNSHITDKPYEFKSSWVVPSATFKPMRFSILIEYAKEIIDKDLLDNDEDLEYCKEWLRRAKKAYKNNYIDSFGHNSEGKEFIILCNGDKPTFGNAKFTYDLIQYGLSKQDTTKPRKQKLEKMIRDFWSDVESHKDEMNWY